MDPINEIDYHGKQRSNTIIDNKSLKLKFRLPWHGRSWLILFSSGLQRFSALSSSGERKFSILNITRDKISNPNVLYILEIKKKMKARVAICLKNNYLNSKTQIKNFFLLFKWWDPQQCCNTEKVPWLECLQLKTFNIYMCVCVCV